MTRNGHVLSLAVSGLRFTGRTELSQQLKLVLPKKIRGCEFAFLGNPFGHLRHPLQWVREGHKKYALSRLFEGWSMLNEFTEDKWIPAIRAGKIPVMDGCGLDVVLYAMACLAQRCDDEKVLEWHQEMVRDRIVKQGVAPPHYIITQADTPYLCTKLRSHAVVDAGISDQTIESFIERERQAIVSYFEEGSGQHTPHYLESGASIQAMVNASVALIRNLIERERLAA